MVLGALPVAQRCFTDILTFIIMTKGLVALESKSYAILALIALVVYYMLDF
jgi:hypothetical protein